MKEKSVGRWIAVLYRQSQIYLNIALKDLNLSSSEYMFLIVLTNEGMTQEELSDRISIDKAATARALKSLEEKGYITRETDSQDKRAKRVYATEKAKQCKDQIHRVLMDWTSLLTEDMEPETVELVIESLKHMAHRVIQMDFKEILERR